MRRTRMLVGGLIAAGAVMGLAPGGALAQQGNLDKACKKGYVLAAAPASMYDSDGNGFVCVDPTTGDIRDDKGQFVDQAGGGGATDENGDGFICYNPDQGAVTDDDISSGQATCPPGFLLYPAIFFP